MDDVSQHMILETTRPPVRDPKLLPTLQAMLDRNPADKDALAAYLDLDADAEDAIPYVVRAVCAPGGPPLIDTFDKVKEDRLIQVDACLLPLFQEQASASSAVGNRQPNSGRTNFIWKQRVTLAARFGSPGLLSVIESSGARQLTENPGDSGVVGALLAAEMRDNPVPR